MSLRALRRIITPFLSAGLVTVSAGFAAVAVPSTAYAGSNASMESQFVAAANAARAANGQAPYSVAYDLVSVARGHSAAMASGQSLYHNPSLTTEVSNWQAVGENVGEGPTVSDIQSAFMASPEHRANILDHDFTQIGVGVTVDRNGIVWVTEDFREPMGGSTYSPPVQHSTQTVHHSSPAPATTSASQPASSSSYGYQAPAVSHASAPRPTLSPRAVLRIRLTELRHQQRRTHRSSDPVAQAFHYVANLSRLAA